MVDRRRIGIKYCGGCNPRHDRVQAATWIRERLEDRCEFVSYRDRDAEATLIVTGCPTACVNRKPFAGRPVWVVTSMRDAERFVEQMNAEVTGRSGAR
jgi:hypothetical protein